jgi:hypothetical protein
LDFSGKSTKSLRRAEKKNKPRRTMALESLEDRTVMAATLAFTAPGELTITADPAGSRVHIVDLDQYNHPDNINPNNVYIVATTSNDGQRSYTLHKSQIMKFKFAGSSYADIYYAPTGVGWYNNAPTHEVNGLGGDDVITTGLGNDTVYGGSGLDEIHGGGGNDTLEGGSGRDRMWGDSGNDTLRGGSGYDDLYGGRGDDVLEGGADPDLLEGEEGNDRLYGGGGVDFLYGGAGIDGLYGGSEIDQLHGGPDSDRFLILTNETGVFQQTFGGTTISIGDCILDDGDEDIRIRLTNEGARTVTWPSGYSPSTTTYSAGSWSDSDIKVIDEALGTMAEETRNNALLYNSQGGEPQLFRLGNASNQYVAFNDGVNTHYSNQSFQWNGVYSEDWAIQVVFHEFGHNWDTPEETERLLQGWGDLVTEFRAASGWTQTRPSTAGFAVSGDANWWYSTAATFVRNYARTNPFEDYAETFSAYFMDVAGRTWVDGEDEIGIEAAPYKGLHIYTWALLVRGMGAAARPVGAGGVWGDPSATSGDVATSTETLLVAGLVDSSAHGRAKFEVTVGVKGPSDLPSQPWQVANHENPRLVSRQAAEVRDSFFASYGRKLTHASQDHGDSLADERFESLLDVLVVA